MEQNEQNNIQNQTNEEQKNVKNEGSKSNVNKGVKKSTYRKKIKKHTSQVKHKIKPEKKISKEKKQNKTWVFIIIGVLLLLFIVVGLYFTLRNNRFNFLLNESISDKKIPKKSTSMSEIKEELLVEIDDEKITTIDLNNYLKSVPEEIRDQVDIPRALNDLIVQRLFLKDAKAKGIKVNDSEVDVILEAYLNQLNMTKDQFKQQLKAQGVDYNSYYNNIKMIVLLNKYMEEYILDQVTVSEEEIKDFYEQMQIFLGNATYDEVKNDLEFYLKRMKVEDYLLEYLEKLKAKSNIKIYKYNTELCLLEIGATQKIFLYSSENCEPCIEYKKILNENNITYYEFSDEKTKKCFSQSLEKVRGIMPVLFCRDNSFTLSKDPSEIKRFVSNCR